jgi:hypothetical protein
VCALTRFIFLYLLCFILWLKKERDISCTTTTEQYKILPVRDFAWIFVELQGKMKRHEQKSIFGVARRQLLQLPKICTLSAVFKQGFACSAIASSSNVLGRLTADRKSVSLKAHFFLSLASELPRGHGWHAGKQILRREVNIHSFARVGKPKQLQTRKISGKEKKSALF